MVTPRDNFRLILYSFLQCGSTNLHHDKQRESQSPEEQQWEIRTESMSGNSYHGWSETVLYF